MQSTNSEYGSPYLVVCHEKEKKRFNNAVLVIRVAIIVQNSRKQRKAREKREIRIVFIYLYMYLFIL